MSNDLIHGSRHRLVKGDPLSRESLAFMLQLPEAGIAAAIYTWVNGLGLAGSALTVFGPGVDGGTRSEHVDGIEVSDETGFDHWSVGAMRVTVTEPMRSAVVEFAGEQLGLEYRFDGTHPAYLYSTHPDGAPSFFADDRYEQSGRVTGHLRVGDRVFDIDTTAHRDHSWGTRDWGAVQHYKWIVSEAGPDIAVHVFDIQALGRRYLRGYVYKDGLMAEVRDADCTFTHDERWWQTSVAATIVDSAGRTTDFASETFASARVKHGSDLTAIETGMTVAIDSRPGVGHVEMAWQTNYLKHIASTQKVSCS
jgi:hypothetical protein